MNGSPRKLLSVYLTTLIVLSVATPVAFTGVAAAAGNTEGVLSGGVANQPTATQSNPAVVNMSTGVIAQSADADVTVGWDFSPLSGQYDTGNTTLRLYAAGVNSGQAIVTASISSYSATKTLTIPSSQYQFGPQQNFTLRLYNPNSNFGVLAGDTETLEVRSVGSSPVVDMRGFTTRGNGNTQIQVGYDAEGWLNGKSLKIKMVGPNGNTVTTSDLSGDPRGAATMTIPANFGEGQVTFELHIGGVDGTPEATATAQHTLETYISAQSIEYVSGTQPSISNITIRSQTISFGQGGMFQFTLVDSTKRGFGNRDLSGPNVSADESTLVWVNFTVENYAPDVLMGPGDVEQWQFSTSDNTADIDILVHPTSVYRYSQASGFDPTGWKSSWDMADYGLDASVSLAVSDIPGSLGGDLNGARLTTDAQHYRPPSFQQGTLEINVAAPHCKDNATGNSCSGGAVNDDGFYTAVIPKSFWSNNWQSGLEADDLAGTYTSSGTTTNLQMTVTKRSDGALVVNATNIHYSNGTIELQPDSTAPTADAGADTSVNSGETVDLSGSKSSDNRKITTYEWDVDDDNTYEKTGETISHSYSSTGDKTVTLRVTDGNGNTDTDTVTVTVTSSGGSSDSDDDDDDEPVPVLIHRDGSVAEVEVNSPTPDEPRTITTELQHDDTGVGLESVTVSVDTDSPYTLSASLHASPPTGAPTPDPTDTGIEPLSYIQVDHSVSDDAIENAEFAFTVDASRIEAHDISAKDVVLYRYHDGEWTPAQTTFVRESPTQFDYEATLPGLSTFAIGTQKHPSLSVTDVSVTGTERTVGDPVSVTVTVRNDGTAPAERIVALDANDAVVASTTVSVAPGGSETVTLTTSFGTAGDYALDVNGTTVGTVSVVERSTETPTPAPTRPPTTASTPMSTPTAVSGTTAEQMRASPIDSTRMRTDTPLGGADRQSPRTPTSRVPFGQPGFGIGITLAVLLGTMLIAHRIRR